MKKIKLKNSLIMLFCLIMLGSFSSFAQNDSNPETEKTKKEKKKRTSFKVLIGGTINNISSSSNEFDASSNFGYIIGAKYKRGNFFYWEIGARYNVSSFSITDVDTKDDFKINSIDVPINFGVNLLSVTDRLVGLRVYLGGVPTFTTNVPNNDFNITEDDVNSFRMYGQAGVGVDVAFIFLETGVNYGFTDIFKEIDSNPTQIFINLGFRF